MFSKLENAVADSVRYVVWQHNVVSKRIYVSELDIQAAARPSLLESVLTRASQTSITHSSAYRENIGFDRI